MGRFNVVMRRILYTYVLRLRRVVHVGLLRRISVKKLVRHDRDAVLVMRCENFLHWNSQRPRTTFRELVMLCVYESSNYLFDENSTFPSLRNWCISHNPIGLMENSYLQLK